LSAPSNFGAIGLVWDEAEASAMLGSFIDILRSVAGRSNGESHSRPA